MNEEKTLFGKDKLEKLYFMDMNWLKSVGDNGKLLSSIKVFSDVVGLPMAKPLFKESSFSLLQKFESDAVMLSTVTFISP